MSPSPLDYHHAVNCLSHGLCGLSVVAAFVSTCPAFDPTARSILKCCLPCAAAFLVGIFLANL